MSTVVTTRLSDDVLAMVDAMAKSQDRSRAWIVARLVEIAARKQAELDAFIQVGEDSIERGDFYTQEEMEDWVEERIAARRLPVAAE
jgi:predicted transcriptional regulator